MTINATLSRKAAAGKGHRNHPDSPSPFAKRETCLGVIWFAQGQRILKPPRVYFSNFTMLPLLGEGEVWIVASLYFFKFASLDLACWCHRYPTASSMAGVCTQECSREVFSLATHSRSRKGGGPGTVNLFSGWAHRGFGDPAIHPRSHIQQAAEPTRNFRLRV